MWNLKSLLLKAPAPLIKLLLASLIITPALLAAPCTDCCREALFKPKRCAAETEARIDHHATENMGPHGYHYYEVPFYLDGYGHYGSGSWW